MHRVGEFNPVRRKRESRCYGCFILDLDVSQTEQLRECITDNALIKSVQASEDSAGLQQHGLRDPDCLPAEIGGHLPFWVERTRSSPTDRCAYLGDRACTEWKLMTYFIF